MCVVKASMAFLIHLQLICCMFLLCFLCFYFWQCQKKKKWPVGRGPFRAFKFILFDQSIHPLHPLLKVSLTVQRQSTFCYCNELHEAATNIELPGEELQVSNTTAWMIAPPIHGVMKEATKTEIQVNEKESVIKDARHPETAHPCSTRRCHPLRRRK